MTDLKPMNKTLADALSSLARTREEKKQRQINEETITPMAKKNLPVVDEKIMLPEWPDDKRAMPNDFARSSIFGVMKKGNRELLDEVLISSVNNIEVRYTGKKLNQDDLDILMALLHTLKGSPLGTVCEVTSYEILKCLGLETKGNNYKTLENSIKRLHTSVIQIDSPKRMYLGHILEKAHKDKDTSKWLITLNHDLINLFKNDAYTLLDWQIRQNLNGQLAKWLHSFYSTHLNPYPFKIETLKDLCGSETKELRTFKQQITKAMEHISEVSKAHHQIFNYEIKNNVIHVEKLINKKAGLSKLY